MSNLVEARVIETRLSACKADMLPLSSYPHGMLVPCCVFPSLPRVILRMTFTTITGPCYYFFEFVIKYECFVLTTIVSTPTNIIRKRHFAPKLVEDRVGFEPTRNYLPVFKTSAFSRALPPIH